MVFKLSWTRGAQFESRVEEPANGGEPASGATEHSAACAPAIVHIPWHDSWTEPNMQKIAADLLVAEELEQDQLSEADEFEQDQLSEADYDRQLSESEHDADEPDAAEDAPDAPEDAPDAAELRARLKEAKLEEHFNELGAVGFALAKSVSSMGDINSRFQDPWGRHFQMECLDAAWMKPMFGTCSPKEKEELSRNMELFFYQTAVASEHIASERRSIPSKDLEARR